MKCTICMVYCHNTRIEQNKLGRIIAQSHGTSQNHVFSMKLKGSSTSILCVFEFLATKFKTSLSVAHYRLTSTPLSLG